MNDANLAYIAGLFDGEGSVHFKRGIEHNVLVIRMEIAMTDEHVVRWVHDVLGVGAVGPRKVRPGRKKQWRWRCSHRDAYFVALALYENSKVKTNKLQQIIDHYTKKDGKKVFNGKVVNLEQYREAMSLE